MSIKNAVLSDLDIVKKISDETISEIYPHYYPEGAVGFFLSHHSESNIINDIKLGSVFLCSGADGNIVGTVTIKDNEICRLFVLPKYQGNGYGSEMLDYAENIISQTHSEIRLDASLPAKSIYIRRGYKDVEYNVIKTGGNDFLCYDVMVKNV